MSAFHDNALMGASGQQGYKISRSVRLRSSASAYLNRTFGTPTSGTTWTWSGWVKLGTIPSTGTLFEAGTGATNTFMRCTFGQVSAELNWRQVTAVGGLAAEKGTSMLFRDPSAWYHIVCVWDTSNATAADRQRVYVNGLQVTAFGASTNPSLNLVSYFNTASYVHYLGALNVGGLGGYLDGYLTEINFIDGQALTPSSFGETNAVTGVWQPKKYAGTYGTNGFYLNFSDNSAATATTIGKDYSGNGNNWTPNNISVTAGTTYDSMLDVPTLWADGGNGRGNYAVLSPTDLNAPGNNASCTLSNGNLAGTLTNGANRALSTIGVLTGKWYAEVVITSITGGATNSGVLVGYIGGAGNGAGGGAGMVQYQVTGNKRIDTGSAAAYGASYTTGDIIGVALDMDAGQVTFYKNNTSQGAITLTTTGSPYGIGFNWNSAVGQTVVIDANFGQRPFSYTPPTGFVALNTQNLPTPTISNGANYMAATLYTGTGATQSIVNSGNNAAGISFQPDFVWIKDRSAARSHRLFDAVRGATKALFSDATDAETTLATDLTAFNSNGFTLGAGAGSNSNTETFVGWQWKASGSTVSNTSGSITSTVSAGATQGFSVVTYTGTGANATVGHGLGVAPKMIITKPRNSADNWISWHTSLGATGYIYLNLTNASTTGATVWNSTLPTSTVFSIGTSSNINSSGQTQVAYCFAEVAGYSKFGSYTGNGSADGTFVYLGFRPRWVMIKRTDTTASWYVYDTSRNTYNTMNNWLAPNLSNAENTSTTWEFDFLSNGFKVRNNGAFSNASGGTYIFMAVAENPFKLSLAR